MGQARVPDKLDAAVAAASEPAPPPIVTITVNLGTTGRQVLLGVPVDLTAIEALDMCGYIARGLHEQLAAAKAQSAGRGRLIVPGRPTLVAPVT